jgi:DNA-binding NarL/FixJ family response regulator
MIAELPQIASPASDAPVRLLLIDDREVVLRGLADLCDEWTTRTRVWCIADPAHACAKAATIRPHIALVRHELKAPDGTSLPPALGRASPATAIVLMVDQAVAPEPPSDLPIVSLRLPSRRLLESVMAYAGEPPGPQVAVAEEALTVRERRLLEGLAAGETNAEIALRLCLSRSSVKQQAANLYRKLGVRGRAGAAVEAARRGWIE